jgi:toxin-antitoxin system PIN domain toxin
MKLLIFPDVNVWLALNYQAHSHSSAAVRWYDSLDPSTVLVFCRHTQLGLFRLLSTESVMKLDAMNQLQCWEVFDRWIGSGQAYLAQEPPGLETGLRARTAAESASPKTWADAYLSAFAEAAHLTLVTFDRALAGKLKGAVLLS